MYHITDNKRSVESANLLSQALEKILRKHALQTITVSELCAQAGISRSTFYRMFDTPSDIIYWLCDTYSQKLCHELKTKEVRNPEDIFRFCVRHVLEHPKPIEIASLAQRVDIADSAFKRNIAPSLEEMEVNMGHNISVSDQKTGYTIVSAIILATCRDWFENGKKDTIDIVLDRLSKVLKQLI